MSNKPTVGCQSAAPIVSSPHFFFFGVEGVSPTYRLVSPFFFEKIGKIYSSRDFPFQYITPEQSSFQISHLFVVSNLSHLGVILQLPLLFYTHYIAKFLFALLFYTHLGYWPGEISHRCGGLLEYPIDAGMAGKISHHVITAVKYHTR